MALRLMRPGTGEFAEKALCGLMHKFFVIMAFIIGIRFSLPFYRKAVG